MLLLHSEISTYILDQTTCLGFVKVWKKNNFDNVNLLIKYNHKLQCLFYIDMIMKK
jgi:hypothetical protein